MKPWMWEHTRDVHGGQLGEQDGLMDYMFKVTGTFQRCLQHQADEGLQIKLLEDTGSCKLLNSKNNLFTPKLVEPTFRMYNYD